MRPAVLAIALAAIASPALANGDEAAATAPGADAAARWCAPELTELPAEVCASLPATELPGPRTLVLFLHGVIQPDSGWQWAQQRGAARAGARGPPKYNDAASVPAASRFSVWNSRPQRAGIVWTASKSTSARL